LRYATFGRRVGSILIDWILFTPLVVLSGWAMVQPPAVAISVTVVNAAVYYAYVVTGHAVWGQTIGKWKLGLRVVNTDGGRIGWGQSLVRSSVDLALALIATVAFYVVVLGLPREAMTGVSWDEAVGVYDAARPLWAKLSEWAYFAWLGVDTLAMLLNPRRRALHDFVAGTVVINLAPESAVAVHRGRPVWKVVDVAGASLLGATAALFTMAALMADGDPDALLGSIILASWSGMLAALLLGARLAAHRGRLRASTWWRTAAGVLLAVPLLMIVTGLLLSPT
jgi:uncharacterized RDD family membrane protein YckC